MRARHQRVTATLLTVLALLVAVPALGQDRGDLDDIEEEQEQLGEELDVLRADYDELEAALAETAQLVREQEAAKREAEQRLQAARSEVLAARAAVAQMEDEITVLEAQADEDAANLYMNPDPSAAIMDTDDLTTATRREALLSTIASRHSDVLDRLEGLRVDLVDAEARAEDAEAQVEAEQAEVQARLEEYRSTLQAQQRVEAELERRIAAVEEEAAALAEEEASIRAALRRASQAPTLPDGTVDVPPPSSGQLQYPTTGTVTGVFGEDRGDHMHAGIDIANAEGTPIVAAESGTVIGGCGGGYGNCVLIDHGNGMVTLYAHQSVIQVGSGSVQRGQQIGLMGCTGSCTGPHLHFEVRINGTPHDPMAYF
ncbi:MAG TPA: peptidoglycan DD-metalloendopeptidase family protein [Acidimicrobiales bacterium]|nr:peptidoglycan DD-metalloendopeptidase family protein [Acidimicrobiales bacterium]